jgi:hypothetical protein
LDWLLLRLMVTHFGCNVAFVLAKLLHCIICSKYKEHHASLCHPWQRGSKDAQNARFKPVYHLRMVLVGGGYNG